MKITKTSGFTGVVHTLDIPVTQKQIDAWKNGELIQNAMPQLSAQQREFFITGTTQEEWNDAFPQEEEEDYDDVEELYRIPWCIECNAPKSDGCKC